MNTSRFQHFGLKVTSEPSTEPVSVAEAKAHARVDTEDENALIGAMITAARDQAEDYTRRAFVNTTFEMKLDCFPIGRSSIIVPVSDLVSVTSIEYVDEDEATQTLASSKYIVDTHSTPGRIAIDPDEAWPTTREQINAVEVTFVAGFGSSATDVPQAIRQAIKSIFATLYEHRETKITGTIATEIPEAAKYLLDPYVVDEVQ